MAKDRAKAVQEAGFDVEDLEWISSLRHDINEHQETASEKFMRKLKSNPLVPIGKTFCTRETPCESGAPSRAAPLCYGAMVNQSSVLCNH